MNLWHCVSPRAAATDLCCLVNRDTWRVELVYRAIIVSKSVVSGIELGFRAKPLTVHSIIT